MSLAPTATVLPEGESLPDVAARPRGAVRATPQELLDRTDQKDYELVDGILWERSVSALSSFVAFRLGALLSDFCVRFGRAWGFGADCGYLLAPDTVRKPDVSVVLAERLPASKIGTGWLAVAPDLAVEVLSPGDLIYAVDAKIEEYRKAGVRLVWILNPEQRTARIHRIDGSVALLHEADTLDGEDVLPGFRCLLASLFPAPAAAPEAQVTV
jgi:Uma2 family endonuclease